MNKFLRLHVHSVHSTRDAMLPVETIVEEAVKHKELPSLTDHGSIGGAIEFIKACEKHKTVGAFGCEFYLNKHIKRLIQLKDLIANEKDAELKKEYQLERDSKRRNNHLLLLAKNTHGFYNILALNNVAYIDGFYNKPTIDYTDIMKTLKPDADGDLGVIMTTACIGGPTGQYILDGDVDSADEWLKIMKKAFGKDLYIEVQVNGLKDQRKLNKAYLKLAEKHKIKLCVGIDAHYLEQSWADTHQNLLLLQNKNTRSDLGKYDYRVTWMTPKGEEKIKKVQEGKNFRKDILVEDVEVGMEFGSNKKKDKVIEVKKLARAWEFGTDHAFYKSEADIRKHAKKIHKELVPDIDKIIKGNYDIAKKITPIELDKENKLPSIENAYEELKSMVKKNLKDKAVHKQLYEDMPVYIDRLKMELDVIHSNGYEDYFLILADVMQFARDNDIGVGPARGSSGGCLVAYLTGITRMDPYNPVYGGNLMFERFLNPDRLTSPDIDVDFDGNRRDDIIDYLIDKYGENYVAYVGVRSEYSSKSAIRDLGTVYEIPSSESVMCTKGYNAEQTVGENMITKPDVKQYFTKHEELKDQVDRLTGTISSLGIHAGGVIISNNKYPINNYCALQRPGDDGRVATLWDKKELEHVGFVKYDLLGVSSVAQVHKAMRMIGLDPYTDAPEEEDVFRDVVLQNKNKNIFQFETVLGSKAFEDFLPMNIKELANASAVLRVVGSPEGRRIYDTYKENVDYLQQGNTEYWKEQLRDEILDDRNYEIAIDVLSNSYGVLIFQEQLGLLINRFSDGELSFGQGDIFRRALEDYGKKNGMLDDHQGNPEGLKRWHKGFMKLFDKYVFPYIGEDINYPGVQDFIDGTLNANNELETPKHGIVSWMISSAAYLFNKLHAVAYSINTYNMMWLKHHYPLEFWTASLQLEERDLDKIRNYITAIKNETDIKVLPPDVNHSELSFTMDKEENSIRYGLKGILGLGNSASSIVDNRNDGYKDIPDFVDKITGSKVNKKTIYNLLSVNGFQDFGTQKKVHKAFEKAGKELDELETNSIQQALLESKLLGGNISFVHPIAEQANMYLPLSEVDDGAKEVIAVRILKTYDKVTKNDKPYRMYRVECLNSGVIVNLFDWQNRKDLEDYLVCRIKKSGSFYTLLGPSSHSPIYKSTKAAARRAISK